MSCPNATAPINLIRNLAGVCRLKCNYEQHYKPSAVSAENRGEYIRYTFPQSDIPPVTFNSEQYNVGEMRLYRPSLHRFGGVQCEGEIMIDHTNISQNMGLLVCIPIVGGGNSDGVMDDLISQVASRANSNGGTTAIGSPSFSIAKLIPNKPFYSYTGTMPVIPCIGTKNYIVFDKLDAIKISGKNLAGLKKIITEQSYGVQLNPDGFYYNKGGQSKGSTEDDIYIDCTPTGEDGPDKKKDTNLSDNGDFIKQPWVKYSAIGIGSFFLLSIIWSFGPYIMKILFDILTRIITSMKTFAYSIPMWVKLFIFCILSPFVVVIILYVMYLFIIKLFSM